MTAAVAPKPAGGQAGASLPSRRRRPVQRVRSALGTTSGRYRVWSLAGAVALVVAGVAATAAAAHMRSSTQRASINSGPVLVATQQLVSSLAEADAAATAAFLSGRDEDPEQRRLYEQALARGNQQIESIAALVGADAAVHTALQRVSVQVTRYAGLVEAARVTNKAGGPDAKALLTQSVRQVDQIVKGDLARLTRSNSARLHDDAARRGSRLPLTVLALLGGLGVLVAAQLAMVRTSRRILNIPLVLATVLLLAAFSALVRADRSAAAAQEEASRKGFDSVALTVLLATSGFATNASETLALISASSDDRAAAAAHAAQVAGAEVTPEIAELIRAGQARGAPGGFIGAAAEAADNPRERAAVAEVAIRWQRYRDAGAPGAGVGGDAVATSIAPSNAAFNGFNFSVESLVGQNRRQFLRGLDDAAATTARLPGTLLVLVGAALLAMFWGFQIRIDDYR